jgi:hypothetical protein
MNDRLPELVDAKQVMAEMGVTKAAAEKIMAALDLVQFPGLRKNYVRRVDLIAYIEAHTLTREQRGFVQAPCIPDGSVV